MHTDTQTEINQIFKHKKLRQFAVDLLDIVRGLQDYWPLTVRQVYYQAVAALLISNVKSEYTRTSRVLTALRRADILAWSAIDDRTRRTINKRGISGLYEFLKQETDSIFHPQYYQRCYVSNQPVYVEVATEKDALAAIVQEAVYMYCTRLRVVRGQVSATMVEKMAEAYDRAIMRGQRPVLLYLGDLDPSGVAIPKALKRNLYDHHSIDVELVRIALNPEQVKHYNLPETFDAAKQDDPNYQKWLTEYGNQAPVELDALHPKDLTSLIQNALHENYDMTSFEHQQIQEHEERQVLKKIRTDTLLHLKRNYPEHFSYV